MHRSSKRLPNSVLSFVVLPVIMVSRAFDADAQLQRDVIATSSDITFPVYATAPPNDTTRLFVVEKAGVIKIIRLSDNAVLSTPFLDISGDVDDFNEGGLFAMAFHPNYASNGYFFVHYTSSAGTSLVKRYKVSGDANVADSNSGVTFLEVSQLSTATHNGGMIGFRPGDANHYLYVALGDGENGSGRPNGQDTGTKLGAILRLDVDAGPPGDPTSPNVPSSNPFFGGGGDPAIWAYGLRNPFRFSFDRLTADLYISDVGQSDWEEIDFQASTSGGGENFGWSLLEGTHDFDCTDCDGARSSTTLPIYEYGHTAASGTVTGGFVYRGDALPELTGRYFFADFLQDKMWSFVYDGSSMSDFMEHTSDLAPDRVVSFGEDADGNLYFLEGPGDRVIRITDPDPITEQSTVYADFDYLGPQFGTQQKPYYKITLALQGVLDDGTIIVQAGSTDEALTITKPVRIEAAGGTATFGAMSSGMTRSEKGFVSR